jgi:hypothetical protein
MIVGFFSQPEILILSINKLRIHYCRLSGATRPLGLVVCRGTQVSLICPADGMEEIANPFEDAEDEIIEGEA